MIENHLGPQEKDLDDELLDSALRAGHEVSLRPLSGTALLQAGDSAFDFPAVRLRAAQHAGTELAGTSLAHGATALDGRYEIRSEIGKGGVGRVCRAHDTELGRDIALKILHERHLHNPSIVDRFVEEAQICAQLNHPAIVPIHEIGLWGERTPFISMKLVRGETLAELLARRERPGQDSPRFLIIFEQICQAVGYAHTVGVVHRDLKPANVMVGQFGEVHVMDWGMAKVLDRPERSREDQEAAVTTIRSRKDSSESISGSVMGTPAYMPPEQARGEVEKLDERSDVFSLGAILCEILTGQPPYVGGTQESIRHQASEGKLEGALARLAESGADAELVRIASSSLEPEQHARPRDARVLADELSAYMTSVEERLRQVELSRAAAEARAHAEGRARRLTVALAGVVLLITLVSGGGYLFLEQQNRARRDSTSLAVNQAMGEAKLQEGQARAAAIGDLTSWDLALAAARRAEAAATAGSADAATHSEIAALLETFTGARAAAGAEAARLAEDKRVLAELERIRDASLFDVHSAQAFDASYAQAFLEYGIDIDALSVIEAASAIRDSGIGEQLAGFLDPWSTTRMLARTDKSRQWTELLDIALLADEDEWRTEMREAVRVRDRSGLVGLAHSAPVGELPPVTLQLMGEALAAMEEHAVAVDLLVLAQCRFPQDFHINRALAGSLEHLSPPRWQAAVQFHSAAVACRPDSLRARVDLGIATDRAGSPDAARVWFDSALDLDAQFGNSGYLSARLLELGETGLALEAIEKALEARPGSDAAWGNKGRILFRMRDFEGAVRAHEEAIEIAPIATNYNGLGAALVYLGRHQEALAAYRAGILANPNDYLLRFNLGALLVDHLGELSAGLTELEKCADLNPFLALTFYEMGKAMEGLNRRSDAVDAYREAIRLQGIGENEFRPKGAGENDFLPYLYNFIGVWSYDQGDFEEAAANFRAAIELFEEAVARSGESGKRQKNVAMGHFNLGNCQRNLGLVCEAVASYRTAIRADPTYVSAYRSLGDLLLGRHEVEEALVVYRAAYALEPANMDLSDGLGWCLIQASRHVEAIRYLRQASSASPEDARLAANLAYALELAGRFSEARDMYFRLLEVHENDPELLEEFGTSFDECSRLIELEERLAEVVSGKQVPADAVETAEFAIVATRKELYGASAQLWLSALAADPDLREDRVSGEMCNAACSLALAGCSLGKDAGSFDAEIRASWRRQALARLTLRLEDCRSRIATGEQADRDEAVDLLKHWKHDRCLVGVRDEAGLEKLPETEQTEWRAFWTAAKSLLAGAEE